MFFNLGNIVWLKNVKFLVNYKVGFFIVGFFFDKVLILWKCLDFFLLIEVFEIWKVFL